jgi:hypothetical protein
MDFWFCFTSNTFFHHEFEGEHGEGEIGQQLTAKKPIKATRREFCGRRLRGLREIGRKSGNDHDEDNEDEDDEGGEDTENSRDKSVENEASKKRTLCGAPKVPVSQIFLTFIVDGQSSGVGDNSGNPNLIIAIFAR